jgi:hypothetical protein
MATRGGINTVLYASLYIPLPPGQTLFAQLIGISCLPLGLYMACLASLEIETRGLVK